MREVFHVWFCCREECKSVLLAEAQSSSLQAIPSNSYVCAMTYASRADLSLEMSVRHRLNEIQSDLDSGQPPFSVFLNIVRRVHKTFDECIGYEVELEMRSLDRHRRLQERLEADQQAAAVAAEFAELGAHPLQDDEVAAAEFLGEDADAEVGATTIEDPDGEIGTISNWPSTMPMPPPPPMREEVVQPDDVEPIESHTPRVVPRRFLREPEPQCPQPLRLRSRSRTLRSPVRLPRQPLAPPPLHVRCKARPA